MNKYCKIYSVLRKSKNFADLSTVGLVKEEDLLPLIGAVFLKLPCSFCLHILLIDQW